MNKDQQTIIKLYKVIDKILWLTKDRLLPAEESLDWIRQYIKDYAKGRDVSVTDEWMKKIDGIDPEKRMARFPMGTKKQLPMREEIYL